MIRLSGFENAITSKIVRADERCGRKQLLVVVDCRAQKGEASQAKRYKSESVSTMLTHKFGLHGRLVVVPDK